MKAKDVKKSLKLIFKNAAKFLSYFHLIIYSVVLQGKLFSLIGAKFKIWCIDIAMIFRVWNISRGMQ